jgi:uncharacterized Zn-binding protein involved in type VI secretion
MKDQHGRGVIRIGDKTTHGGEVISAAPDFTVLGKQVALEGDTTYCPQCKGTFSIHPGGDTRRHRGKRVAYHEDLTSCGAKLISSI